MLAKKIDNPTEGGGWREERRECNMGEEKLMEGDTGMRKEAGEGRERWGRGGRGRKGKGDRQEGKGGSRGKNDQGKKERGNMEKIKREGRRTE